MGLPTVNIDLGDFSKPATVLIDRVSDAVGGIAKPWQIRRVARADSDAALIKATSELEISELQRRGLERFVREESQKQANIEDVTQKALPHLNEDSKPEDVERDWLTHFFDRCRLTSSSEMQELWSRILAGEANSPGVFSRRTVNLVATLDKDDAAVFSNICRFVWLIEGNVPLIYFGEKSWYQDYRLNFETLHHLATIGLILFDPLSGYSQVEIDSRIGLEYFGNSVRVEFPKKGSNSLDIGNVLFTQAGQQLARVCEAEAAPGYFDKVLDRWQKQNLILSSPSRIDIISE